MLLFSGGEGLQDIFDFFELSVPEKIDLEIV